MWIGLNKKHGRWIWLDGSELDQSQPDWCYQDPDGEGNCVDLKNQGGFCPFASWNDRSCQIITGGFLCQIGG